MLSMVLILSVMLPTHLMSIDVISDNYYLSELGPMEIIPPMNETRYSKDYYDFAHGQYLVSIGFHDDQGRVHPDHSVFVTMSNDQAVSYFNKTIKFWKSNQEKLSVPIVNYIVKNGYIYWSRNNDNLKLVIEYKSKVDYSKYEKYLNQLCDQIMGHEVENLRIASNYILVIESNGTTSDGKDNAYPVISFYMNYKRNDGLVRDTTKIFLTEDDANIHYAYMSRFLPIEYGEYRKGPVFEDIELTNNIVKYSVRIRGSGLGRVRPK